MQQTSVRLHAITPERPHLQLSVRICSPPACYALILRCRSTRSLVAYISHGFLRKPQDDLA
jgi:hypothetical protein